MCSSDLTIYKAIYDDLGLAAKGKVGGKAASTLRAAINASKKEFARDELSNLIELRIKTRAADQLPYINSAAIKDALRKSEKGKDILSKLGAGEIAEIESLLNKITPPGLPPPGGANFGSGRFFRGEALITGIGYLLGYNPATAAAIGGVAQGVPYVISRLLVTKPGRDFLRTISTAKITPEMPKITVLYQTLKSLFS